MPNSGERSRWGTLGLGHSVGDLTLLALFPFIFNTLSSFDDNFYWSDQISSSDVFADKRHIAPRLSLVNVPALNKLLRSEVFISEDRKLRAVHLILDYKPLSRTFQDASQAIRAGDSRLARINVSVPGFFGSERSSTCCTTTSTGFA